jgi:hypothetical protein
MFEDIKGMIRSCKSQNDRQDNDQKKKDERTNNDLQNTTQKTKELARLTPTKLGMELWCPEMVSTNRSINE